MDVGDARGRRGPGAGIEGSEFAEHVGRPDDRQQDLPPVGGPTVHLGHSALQDEEAVALLALTEDDGTAREIDAIEGRRQRLRDSRVQSTEEIGPEQCLVHQCLSVARSVTGSCAPRRGWTRRASTAVARVVHGAECRADRSPLRERVRREAHRTSDRAASSERSPPRPRGARVTGPWEVQTRSRLVDAWRKDRTTPPG